MTGHLHSFMIFSHYRNGFSYGLFPSMKRKYSESGMSEKSPAVGSCNRSPTDEKTSLER